MTQALTAVQLANLNYIDYDTPKKTTQAEHKGSDATRGTDVDQVVYRIANVHAHQSLTWLELSTCWRPYRETGYRQRANWTLKRLSRAVDEAEEMGLIESTDSIGSNYRLTITGKHYTPTWQLDDLQASLL